MRVSKNLKNGLSLCVVALLVGACDKEPPLSVSPVPLLDDLTQNPQLFPQVGYDQMLDSIAQGDLIDLGESHELGVERTYIAQIYSDLATRLNPLPVKCLVESAAEGGATGKFVNGSIVITEQPLVLSDGPSDPVYPQFSKVCPGDKMFANPTMDYTDLLKQYLPEGRVLTHTGLRHMLPWGQLYPQDFLDNWSLAQWVDLTAHGTINREVTDSFVEAGKKVRAQGPQALEDLLFPQLVTTIQSELKKKVPAEQIRQELDAEVAKLMANPALQFGANEVAHNFEMHRVNLSFPNELAYLSILNHAVFKIELLKSLLDDPQMAAFLAEIDPSYITAGVTIPTSANESFGIAGNVFVSEGGTIYFTANVAAKEKTTKEIAYILVSPTLSPQLQSTLPLAASPETQAAASSVKSSI
jgi:hypothetical protein